MREIKIESDDDKMKRKLPYEKISSYRTVPVVKLEMSGVFLWMHEVGTVLYVWNQREKGFGTG